MPPYCYSPLPEGSIRLLRLLPDQDERSPIRCRLFDFALLDSQGTCPYESLSYVWGSEDKPQSISVDGCDLPVGRNLHVALSHLRHGFLERILWVDAICINQQDPNEKGRQVQSMAKIYAKASCVVVWLGEAASDDRQALEEIRNAAVGQFARNDETKEQVVLTLLRRPWFQRIWVLQEVAAARHVLIKCGPTEIDGHAFCSGLSALELSYAASPDLQALARPVMYLIRGAIFRSRSAPSQSPRFTLDISPLSELVEMYHTRKATQRHDKVYALLGMSSDDPSAAGLSADYEIPWGRLFQQLINFLLSEQVSVDTWDDKEMAVIKAKGRVLGQVTSVQRDASWEDTQTVDISWRSMSAERKRGSRWSVQASAKPIQVGDIVCLIQGASRPTIIRLNNDFWMVVMMTVSPTDDPRAASRDVKWSEVVSSVTTFPRDLQLVWDWNMRPGNLNDELPGGSGTEDHLGSATRLGNIGLVLRDIERYEEAEKNLRKSVEALESALKSMGSPEAISKGHAQGEGDEVKLKGVIDLLLKVEGGWPPLGWATEDGHEAVVKLLLDRANPDAKDEDGQTPILWAAANGYEEVIKLLLNTGKVDLNAKDANGQTPLIWAARNGHEAVIKLLLGTGKVDLDTIDEHGETPLGWAAKTGHEAVVKLLLGKVDLNAKDCDGRTPLWLAAENGREEVIKVLLGSDKVDPDAQDEGGQTPLLLAANSGYDTVVKLLLDTNKVNPNIKDKYGRTPLLWAAKNGYEAVVKLLLGKVDPDAVDQDGRTPLWLAAENGHEAVVKLLLGTGKVDHFLDIQNEDHFDQSCQQLCSQVQQWVLRFSKASDTRACRLTSEISEEQIIDRLDNTVLDGSDVDAYLAHRTNRRDILMSVTMNMIWEFIFTRYLFGLDREQRQKLKSLEKILYEAGPPEAIRQWRAVTLTLLSKREPFKSQRDHDAEAVVQAIFQTICKILPPPNQENELESQLRKIVKVAVQLSIKMRTQKAEYMMLPPLQPEYDADGELVDTVLFNASLMNERSGSAITNEDFEARGATVRVVLFPLVVKKGDDSGYGDTEIVVCPAQVSCSWKD
ncbi:hypothetical protein ACHAPT_012866 [Fusarium lateritium]